MQTKIQVNKANPGELFIRKDGKTCIFIGKDYSQGRLRYRFRLQDEHEDRKKEVEYHRSKHHGSSFVPNLMDELPPMTDFFQDWYNNPDFRRDVPHRMREGDWVVNHAGHFGQDHNSIYNIISKL